MDPSTTTAPILAANHLTKVYRPTGEGVEVRRS